MSVLRLYDYAASANCYKVRLLLAQLEIPWERVPIDIFAGDTLTEDFGALNPARRTPVLEIAPGVVLPESGAILLYLAEGSPLLPAAREARAQVHRWLFFEQSMIEPAVGGARFWRLTGRAERHPERFEAMLGRARESLAMLDAHLTGRTFLVGDDYTVADLALYAYTHVAHEAGIDMDAYPAVAAWLQQVEGVPRMMNDLAPYPDNARVGQGRSVHG